MSTRRIDGQSGEYKEVVSTKTISAKKHSISGVPDAAPASLNYLLVMPRFVDKVGEWYQFPLGIPYVSSCMKAAGLNVYTVNMNHEEGDVAETVQTYIKKHEIGMVLTGGLSFQYNAIKEILRAAKEYDPNIATVAGGGIITSAPEAGMEVLAFADYGIIGEGEETTPELCRVVAEHGDPLSVNGLIIAPHILGEELRETDNPYKRGYRRTMPRKEVRDLDSIPFPDYDGFDFSRIAGNMANLLGINEDHAITMTSSRSCPFQCTFCFHTSGSHYRKRSLDNFFGELDILVEKYGIKYIFVSDELFAYNLKRVIEFCERIKPYNIRWWAQFRVSDVTEEMLRALKDANCVTMGFGLESADDRILASMNKKIKFEQTERALKLTYDYGITIQGGFIFGDVEETLETATKTLNWWKDHPEYGITLNFITAYPGTPLYKQALHRGLIKDEVQFIRDGCPVVNLSKMSKSEMDWVAEQIMTLPQRAFLVPDRIREVTLDYEEKRIGFTGDCTSCGIENTWKNVRFFTRNVLTCKDCGKKHKLPILHEVTDCISHSVMHLLERKGRIAFWGINDYFANMLPNLPAVQSPNAYLIDNSRIKQGGIIEGKEIHAPAILDTLSIDTVVIPVVFYVTIIEKQIRAEYPHVKEVINILDLIQPMEADEVLVC